MDAGAQKDCYVGARIADRAESLLSGSQVRNIGYVEGQLDSQWRPVYPLEMRKVKCKEFLLRALSKFGYIKLAKGSVQQVREKANV